MNWIFYALLSPAVYSIVNYVDKYVLSRQIKDYRGLIIYTGIVAFALGTIVWFFTGMPTLSLLSASIVLAAGMLYVFAGAIYFKVLSTEETSTVILLFQAIPVFVLLFSYLFLHETITTSQLMGFLIILASTAALAFDISGKTINFKPSKSMYLILFCDVLWALGAVLMKFAVEANSFTKILSFESWGLGLGALVLYVFFPNIRQAFHKTHKKITSRNLTILVVNEAIFAISRALAFYAYVLGSVALVSVLGSTQTFFGIMYGWVLTLMFPRTFKEDISHKALIKKFALSAVMAYGIWILS